jgi:hypothetical protein
VVVIGTWKQRVVIDGALRANAWDQTSAVSSSPEPAPQLAGIAKYTRPTHLRTIAASAPPGTFEPAPTRRELNDPKVSARSAGMSAPSPSTSPSPDSLDAVNANAKSVNASQSVAANAFNRSTRRNRSARRPAHRANLSSVSSGTAASTPAPPQSEPVSPLESPSVTSSDSSLEHERKTTRTPASVISAAAPTESRVSPGANTPVLCTALGIPLH